MNLCGEWMHESAKKVPNETMFVIIWGYVFVSFDMVHGKPHLTYNFNRLTKFGCNRFVISMESQNLHVAIKIPFSMLPCYQTWVNHSKQKSRVTNMRCHSKSDQNSNSSGCFWLDLLQHQYRILRIWYLRSMNFSDRCPSPFLMQFIHR